MERIINQLEMTDPEDLLPEDQYLLEVDPEDLAKASSDGRKTWHSNLETALIVAENHKRRQEHEADDKEDELQSFHFRPPPSDKRCIVSEGQRWRNQIRQKRIQNWKRYNFLGQKRIRDELEDEHESIDKTPTLIQPQKHSTMRQTQLNSWLTSKGSQRYRKRRKK